MSQKCSTPDSAPIAHGNGARSSVAKNGYAVKMRKNATYHPSARSACVCVKWSVCHSRSNAHVNTNATKPIQLVRAAIPSASKTTPSKSATAKTAVGSITGSFAISIKSRTNGMAAASAGTLRRESFPSTPNFRKRKVVALEKKIPNPPTTVRIPTALSASGGAVRIHNPAVTSVAIRAITNARMEREIMASASAIRSMSNTHAQTANDVCPSATQINKSASASNGTQLRQPRSIVVVVAGRAGQTEKPA